MNLKNIKKKKQMNQVCCSDERIDCIFLLVLILIPNIYGEKREKNPRQCDGENILNNSHISDLIILTVTISERIQLHKKPT